MISYFKMQVALVVFLIVKVQASKIFKKITENKNHLEFYHYHHFVLYN